LGLEASLDSDSETDSSERPVQGPLPFEPEDAPWKRNETSGIRKFFRRVFGATVPAEEAEICDQESSSGTLNSSNFLECFLKFHISSIIPNNKYILFSKQLYRRGI